MRREGLARIVGGAAAFLLFACSGPSEIPPGTALARPAEIRIPPPRATPASVNVDTNQFSYIMGAFAYPIDDKARVADARAASDAIADELARRLKALGFRVVTAREGETGGGMVTTAAGPVLIIEGTVTNITEAIPAALSTFDAGQPASQVNARFRLLYQAPGAPPKLWRNLTAAAPVTAPAALAEEESTPAATGPALTYVVPRRPPARTEEVAAQARRLADRLAERLRELFAAQGWLG